VISGTTSQGTWRAIYEAPQNGAVNPRSPSTVSGPALCRASPGLTFARSLPSDRGKTCSESRATISLAAQTCGRPVAINSSTVTAPWAPICGLEEQIGVRAKTDHDQHEVDVPFAFLSPVVRVLTSVSSSPDPIAHLSSLSLGVPPVG
jgi:hypothetical protein